MRTLLPTLLVLLLCLLLAPPAASKDEATRGLRYPSLSPDGSLVTFAYRGDIWVAETKGKDPRITRLTIHEAQDTLPRFSPDGKHIAFSSLREGAYDVYVVPVVGGVPKRVTHHSGLEIVCDWTQDGKHVLFSIGREECVHSTCSTASWRVWFQIGSFPGLPFAPLCSISATGMPSDSWRTNPERE